MYKSAHSHEGCFDFLAGEAAAGFWMRTSKPMAAAVERLAVVLGSKADLLRRCIHTHMPPLSVLHPLSVREAKRRSDPGPTNGDPTCGGPAEQGSGIKEGWREGAGVDLGGLRGAGSVGEDELLLGSLLRLQLVQHPLLPTARPIIS